MPSIRERKVLILPA
jgi:micrococcal nuclease